MFSWDQETGRKGKNATQSKDNVITNERMTTTKCAFQSKTARPPTCMYLVTFVWPWTWPRDLDTRPWPRYSVGVPRKRSFYKSTLSQLRTREQDRPTHRRDWAYYHAAFAGVNNFQLSGNDVATKSYRVCHYAITVSVIIRCTCFAVMS